MKKLKLYRVQDCTRHYVEWFSTQFKARQRAREMVGLGQNQPIADIIDIFECNVSRAKQHILVGLNRGGWYGDERKIDEVNQNGFVALTNWTTTGSGKPLWGRRDYGKVKENSPVYDGTNEDECEEHANRD